MNNRNGSTRGRQQSTEAMIRSASALSASARRCCSLQLNLRSAAVAATLWQAQLHRLRPEQQIALGYRSQRFFASLREISDRSGHRNSDGQLKQRKKPVTQRQRRVRDTQRLKKIAAGKLGSSITVANLSRLLEVKQRMSMLFSAELSSFIASD